MCVLMRACQLDFWRNSLASTKLVDPSCWLFEKTLPGNLKNFSLLNFVKTNTFNDGSFSWIWVTIFLSFVAGPPLFTHSSRVHVICWHFASVLPDIYRKWPKVTNFPQKAAIYELINPLDFLSTFSHES